jgi:serine/threonine protein kinase
MPWLDRGRTLVSDVTQMRYQVTSSRVARGGFGEVYRGVALTPRSEQGVKVALKVSLDPMTWHAEAYFGRLLSGHPQVVPMLDAFPVVDGSGRKRRVKYVLVFPWMDEGTVDDSLAARSQRWSEHAVIRQVSALLDVLALLHRRGICHGDITPRNLFLQGGRILLGDLGIAKQALSDRPVELSGRTPEVFAPPAGYPFYWSPSEDVYQVGLIALSLLSGQVVTTYELCGKLLKALSASDGMKGWLRDAVAAKGDRFENAIEAKLALRAGPVKPPRAPSSIRGQHVVFTGTLPIRRAQAQARARAAGAIVQPRVNRVTTLVVAGQPNPLQIGQKHGTKLFDAHRQIRRGQRIAIIDAKRFVRLVASSKRKN